MEEQNNRSSLWITIVAALPVFYVLSIGPVDWVLRKQLHMAKEPVWFVIFYSPLGWLCDHWSAFGSAMEEYGKLLGL
ncbi:MAG: hypothetical protein K8R87_02415 [Verrucomicrobia bacterium]|nr:hypothetical protein [Verrucomicrobiota bacterium]